MRELQVSDQLSQIATVRPDALRERTFTRGFDFVCAALGLLALTPAFVLIAVAIKVSDQGSVFYRQERTGKGFRPFRLLKFRTMVEGAESAGLLTSPGDSRVTKVGRWLRKYKLDESPQLLNVLAGDMQLVGARPEVPKYVAMFRAQYEEILREPPGLTDPASIVYRNEQAFLEGSRIEEQYASEILPHKLRLSLEYQRRRTFFSDVRILLQTLKSLA